MTSGWWSTVFTIGLLATVVYSDFRIRSVSLVQLLALAAGCIGVAWSRAVLYRLILNDTLINLAFLALQFGLVWLWFAVKHRRMRGVLDRYIGTGDWLFLAAVTPALTPLRFVWYYTSGIFLTLAITLIIRIIYAKSFQTIPLAGCLAVWLAVWLLFESRIPL